MQNYRSMSRDMLQDATESTIFVCGMAPLDADDPLYDVFHRDPSLDCNAHIEAHFYTSKIQPERVEMYVLLLRWRIRFSGGVALFPQDSGWALLYCASC